MDGRGFRLAKFLSRAEKLVVAAIDHGAFHGPIKGLEDPTEAYSQLIGADAILMAPGIARHVTEVLAGPAAPLLIIRLVWNSTYCFQWKYFESHHRPLLAVDQAVAKGADLVLASLSIKTGCERVDAENVSTFSQCCQQAEELGIPIIGEFFPAKTEEMTADELHENVKIGCRVAAELGADLIKTFYTGPRFAEIVERTPVPVLVLGAEKTPTERDALELAARAAESGARGIVFGRNIFQSCRPANFIRAVRAVMNNNCDVVEAIEEYELGDS